MRVTVLSEARIFEDDDGNYVSPSSFDHAFWTRYLAVFDQVEVVCRVGRSSMPGDMRAVDGPGVSVSPLPYYVGMAEYLQMRRRWTSSLRQILAAEGPSVILRMPGNTGRVALRHLRGRPFAVEVVGDPATVFKDQPGLRFRFATVLATRSLALACKRAVAVAYVTSHVLPDRYPASPGTPVFYYSSVTLPPEAYATGPASPVGSARPPRLVAVGSMAQPYKGFDTLLKALASAIRMGHELELSIVGDGVHRGALMQLARTLGIGERVRFVGEVSSSVEVREHLDRADLFVSSSRTEGLPRSVIEAMARGLPCVGTDVGGTPELLPQDAMCPPDQPDELASLILRYLDDDALRGELSQVLFERSKSYAADLLQQERTKMYSALARATRAYSRA